MFWRFLGSTIGRICFSIIFLMAGVKKFMAWGAVKGSMGTMLAQWHSHCPSGFMGWLVNLIGNYVGFFLVVAAILEIVGGLFILIGVKPRIGAFLLLIFMIPMTLFMHPFWIYDPSAGDVQVAMFFKNLAMIGALFFIWAYDCGYYKAKGCSHSQGDHMDHSNSSDHHDFPGGPPEDHQ